MPDDAATLRAELNAMSVRLRAAVDRIAVLEEDMGAHVGPGVAIGADDSSHPRQRLKVATFGRGAFRVDDDGIKFANQRAAINGISASGIVQPSGGALFPGIYVLSNFDQSIFSGTTAWGQLAGYVSLSGVLPATMLWRLMAAGSAVNVGSELPTWYSLLDLHNGAGDGGGGASLLVTGDAGPGTTQAGIEVDPNVVYFVGTAVRLPGGAALDEGYIKYDDTVHSARIHNGSSYVLMLDEGFFNTKGELIVATADDTASKLSVGADYKAIFANSGEATGLIYRPTWYLLDATGVENKWNTSATETTLYSVTVPANSMGANGIVRMIITGYYKNNSAAGDTFRMRVKFGGTTHYSDLTGAITANAQLHPFYIEVLVQNKNATNSQWIAVRHGMNFAGATTGIGDIGTVAGQFTTTVASDPTSLPAIDTTAAATLAVTIQLTTSDANIEFAREMAYCEVMTTP